MATWVATQAIVGTQQGSPEIILQHPVGVLNQNFVLGGTVAPGKARWIPTTASDSDATQAAAILAGLV